MSRRAGPGPVLIVVSVIVTFFLLASISGCRSTSRTELVEKIDEAYRQGANRVSDLTAFLSVMKGFDFEKTSFYGDAVRAIEGGREAVSEIRASLEKLTTCEYAEDMEELQEYVLAYVNGMGLALGELEEIYVALEEFLSSVKPVLEVEAVLTQMEVPQSREEWMERLKGLKESLEITLKSLEMAEVPPLMKDYHAYMMKLFSLMDKLVGDILATVAESGLEAEVERNPDFELLRLLMDEHGSVVEALGDNLRISHIDPLMSRVELEINRLILEESR